MPSTLFTYHSLRALGSGGNEPPSLARGPVLGPHPAAADPRLEHLGGEQLVGIHFRRVAVQHREVRHLARLDAPPRSVVAGESVSPEGMGGEGLLGAEPLLAAVMGAQ